MGGRGRGGRSNTWTRDGGQGRGGRGHAAVGVRRRDLLQEDLLDEKPNWALSCYGPKGEQPNLLGGDTSFEELRCAAYATGRAGGDAGAVHARAREYADAKAGDVKGILAFPEHQLKLVLDRVERGEMAPAGADRVMDGTAIVGGGGGFSRTHAPALDARATPFAPAGGMASGFTGNQPSLTPVATGFVASAQPTSPFGGGPGGGASPFGGGPGGASPFGGGNAPRAPSLTPDPNVPNSEAWCAPSFDIGGVPDDPPPAAYV